MQHLQPIRDHAPTSRHVGNAVAISPTLSDMPLPLIRQAIAGQRLMLKLDRDLLRQYERAAAIAARREAKTRPAKGRHRAVRA